MILPLRLARGRESREERWTERQGNCRTGMVYITRLFEPEDFLMRQTRYLLKMYTPGQPDAQGTAEVQASKVVFALQNVF